MTQPDPRIMMLAVRLPPTPSGAGTQALCLSKSLSASGTCVVIVGAGIGEKAKRVEHVKGITVTRVPTKAKGRLWPYGWGLRVLATLLRARDSYDILHVHGVNIWALPSVLLARLLKKRVVLKMTGHGQDDPIALMRERLGWLKVSLFRLANAVISVSPLLTESYRQSGLPTRRFHYIPNGVDTTAFRKLESGVDRTGKRLKLGLPPTAHIVLYTGIIRPAKGVGLIVEAWPQIEKEVPGAFLVLVGSCTEDPQCAEGIREFLLDRKLNASVVLTGHVQNVVEYLQIADVYVFLSEREGLPNALIEAMACELPCVVRPIRGVTDGLVRDESTGYELREATPSCVAETVVRVLVGKDTSVTKAARERVLRDFCIGRVSQRYVQLYRDVLAASEDGTDCES